MNPAWLPLALAFAPIFAAAARPDENPFSTRIASLAREPVTEGNSARLLVNGPEFYPIRLDLIRDASRTIDLMTFLWCDDESGLAIARALAEAKTKRGVRVRALVSEFNTKPHEEAYRILQQAGIPVFEGPGAYETSIHLHTHEKVFVVDGERALIGSANLCDEYMIGGSRGLWHDLELLAGGPVAARVQGRFDETWDRLAEAEFRARSAYDDLLTGDRETARIYPVGGRTDTSERFGGTARALLEWQQPYFGSKSLVPHYEALIASASERIVVYAPYAILENRFMDALLRAASKGRRVRLFTNSPETNDYPGMLAYGPVADYPRYLEAGVEILEIRDRTLHAKAILIDDRALSIGSNNYTYRSLHANGEAAILTDDGEAVSRFGELVSKDLAEARTIGSGYVDSQWDRFWVRFVRAAHGWVRRRI